MIRSIFRDSLWAFAVKCLGVVGSLLVQAMLARMLTKDDLGYYFLLLSFATFGGLLARFGMRQTVVRFVAESIAQNAGHKLRSSLKKIFTLVSFGVVVACLAVWVGGDYILTSAFHIRLDFLGLALFAVWISALAFQTPIAEGFRGMHDTTTATFIDGPAGNLMILTMLLIFLIGGSSELSLIEIMFITAVSLTMSAIIFGTRLASNVRTVKGGGQIELRDIISVAAPIYVTNVCLFFVGNASLWIAAVFLPATDLADFGIASKLILLVTMPLLIVNLVVQPKIAKLYTESRINEMQIMLRSTASLATVISVAVVLTLIVFPERILTLVFGEGFGDAKYALIIMAVAKLVQVWSGSCGNVLMLTGNQKVMMKISLLTGGLTIPAYFASAQIWGIEAIAIVAAGGWVMQNVISLLIVRQRVGIWTQAYSEPLTAVRNLKTIW